MTKHIIIKREFTQDGVVFKVGDRGVVVSNERTSMPVTCTVRMNNWKIDEEIKRQMGNNDTWFISTDEDHVDIIETEN